MKRSGCTYVNVQAVIWRPRSAVIYVVVHISVNSRWQVSWHRCNTRSIYYCAIVNSHVLLKCASCHPSETQSAHYCVLFSAVTSTVNLLLYLWLLRACCHCWLVVSGRVESNAIWCCVWHACSCGLFYGSLGACRHTHLCVLPQHSLALLYLLLYRFLLLICLKLFFIYSFCSVYNLLRSSSIAAHMLRPVCESSYVSVSTFNFSEALGTMLIHAVA